MLVFNPGKSCALDEPFSCGIGGNCRMTSVKEGVCECLPNYEYAKNGNCIPKTEPISPSDEDSGGSGMLICLLPIAYKYTHADP